MTLHSSKRIALLQLINCMPSCNVETIEELNDGRLFCYLIENVFPETQSELLSQERQNVKYAKQSRDEKLCSSVSNDSEDSKMCEDPIIKSVEAIKSVSEAVQESEIVELNKSVVIDNEFEIELNKSAVIDNESEIELNKSVIIDNESEIELNKSAIAPINTAAESVGRVEESIEASVESLIMSVEFVDNDDISKRYKFIQSFIDVKYNLKSETLITFSECINANELELAKVSIFILSEAVRYYVHMNNSVIHTLSHLDIKVQQDLEQCFNFFINERGIITREETQKILSSHAPYKNSSSPNRSYFVTPRRSCSSKYRRSLSPSTSPLQESVYTDSPLKTYFESPIFTKADIVFKEKEILKTRQILYEEETKCNDLQQKVKDLEKKLKHKDREISDLKVKNRIFQEYEKSEDCEHCKIYEKTIEDKERHIKKLEENIMNRNKEARIAFAEGFTAYKMDVAKKVSKFNHNFHLAEREITKAQVELEQTRYEVRVKEDCIRGLTRKLEEMEKELEMYKEKLSETEGRIKERPETPVLGECIGGYIEEENGELKNEIKQLKLKAHPEEKCVKHVMVQCTEQSIDCIIQNESDMPMSELVPSDDENKKFQDVKKCKENLNKEDSHMFDVSTKLDTTSKHSIGSHNKEIPFAENSCAPVTNDDIGCLWNLYNNSISENEDADEVPCIDNDRTKALSILKKTESVLLQLALSKASPGPNGSNGFVGPLIIKDVVDDLKSLRSFLCLSQNEESQVKFQNDSSVSKNVTKNDEVICNSESVVEVKCEECVKRENDVSNSNINTMIQDYTAELKEKQEMIDNLKKEYERVSKSLNLKEKEQENYKKKCSYLKIEYQESLKHELKRRKEKELKCQKLEMEAKDMRRKIEDFKRKSEREIGTLKVQNKELREKNQNIYRSIFLYRSQLKEMSEKNQKLQDDILSSKTKNEEQSVHIKYLGKQLEDSKKKFKLYGTTNIVVDNKILPNTGVKKEFTYVGGFPKSFNSSSVNGLNEVIILDTGVESTSSGTLCSKSLHGGFPLYTDDDEEAFLNHSSIAEINKDYESADVPNNIRVNELHRRNTMYARHLQSCYPAEGVVMTTTDDNLPKHLKYKKSEIAKPENQSEDEHIGKKRKISEAEGECSKQITTPVVKVKKTFKTPSSLQKLLQFRRSRRPGFIKPKP